MFRGICYLFRLVFRLEKKYIIMLLLSELFRALAVITNIVIPKYILDAIFGREQGAGWAVKYCIIYAGLVTLFGIGIAAFQYASEKARDSLYTKYSILQGRQFLNMGYEQLEMPGFLKLRDQSARYINAYGFAGIIPVTVMLIGKVVTILTLMAVIITLDVRICLIYLVITFGNLFMTVKNKRMIVQKDKEMTEAERKRDYFAGVFEDKKYAKELRTYHMLDWFLGLYAKEYDCVSTYKKAQNMSRLKNHTLRILTDTLQLLLAYVYLIVYALKGKISVGEFTLYLSGMVVFNNTVLDIANTVIDLKQYNEYFEPFRQFTEYLNHIVDGVERIKGTKGYSIEFRNVSFRYPGQSGYALKNINLKIASNEAICIVGENGAGKTTLIKLLLRLYQVEEGEILLNGININRYKTEDYLNCFSVVFQDYKLFAASLKENIILNRKGRDGEQENLKRAMEMSGTAEVLSEKGIHEDVSVSKLFDGTGIEFSGGESQKIAFARALYKDAPILLLDEPSSALDPLSEVKLLENLSLVSQGKLSVFISHRLTSAKICNRILVFHEGELVEDGSHEQLMERAAVYAELYRMQSELYK